MQQLMRRKGIKKGGRPYLIQAGCFAETGQGGSKAPSLRLQLQNTWHFLTAFDLIMKRMLQEQVALMRVHPTSAGAPALCSVTTNVQQLSDI